MDDLLLTAEAGSGASLAWTSDEPAIVRWRELVRAGDLSAAEAVVAPLTSPAALEAVELVRRLRHQWSLTADEVFARLQAEIGDVTREELAAWTANGAIESRQIDGELRYFRREPRNLLLFDAGARERQQRAKGLPATPGRPDSTARIIPTLAEIVRLSEASPGTGTVMPLRTRVNYCVVVKPDRPGAAKGSLVRAWLPFPQVYGPQRDVRLVDSFPLRERVSPRSSAHRTVYFEQKVRDPAKPVRFEVSFEYTTSAVVSSRGRGAHYLRTGRASPEDLAERPPHVVFTDEVRRIVSQQSADSPDASTLAKRLWNWVDDHITWRAEHEYCLIDAIPQQAMRLGRGDCGTQALTYITLCRCAGIPARWQSGWITDPGSGGGMHDWTEIFLDGLGWIPVDPSYGKKQHPDPRVRDFYFGNLDPYRLIVNTDYGRPLSPAKTSLRSEPLDFQRGEIELDGRNLYFDEWEYEMRCESVGLTNDEFRMPNAE